MHYTCETCGADTHIVLKNEKDEEYGLCTHCLANRIVTMLQQYYGCVDDFKKQFVPLQHSAQIYITCEDPTDLILLPSDIDSKDATNLDATIFVFIRRLVLTNAYAIHTFKVAFDTAYDDIGTGILEALSSWYPSSIPSIDVKA